MAVKKLGDRTLFEREREKEKTPGNGYFVLPTFEELQEIEQTAKEDAAKAVSSGILRKQEDLGRRSFAAFEEKKNALQTQIGKIEKAKQEYEAYPLIDRIGIGSAAKMADIAKDEIKRQETVYDRMRKTDETFEREHKADLGETLDRMATSAGYGIAKSFGSVADTTKAIGAGVAAGFENFASEKFSTAYNRAYQESLTDGGSLYEKIDAEYQRERERADKTYGTLNVFTNYVDMAAHSAGEQAFLFWASSMATALAGGATIFSAIGSAADDLIAGGGKIAKAAGNLLKKVDAGTVGGAIAMYTTASAQATKEAVTEMNNINAGREAFGQEPKYTQEEIEHNAALYGVLGGLSESVLEYALGGLTGAKKASETVKNPMLTAMLGYVKGSLGEGMEEMVQSLASYGLKRAIYDENAQLDWQEVIDSGIVGTITGFGMGLPSAVQNTRAAADVQKTVHYVAREANNAATDSERVTVMLQAEALAQSSAEIAQKMREDGSEGAETIADIYEWQAKQAESIAKAIADTANSESGGTEGAGGAEDTRASTNPHIEEIERTGRAVGADEGTIALARDVSSLTGRGVRFFSEAENDGYINNGFWDPDSNTININVKSKNPSAQILSHELTHSIENTDSYLQLRSVIFDRMKRDGMDLDAEYRKKEMLYNDAGYRLRDEGEIAHEIIAEQIEKRYLTDEASIRSLVSENRTLGQRIREWFDSLLAKMGNAEAKERDYVRQVRDLYAKALGEGKTGDGMSEAQYHISKHFGREIDIALNPKLTGTNQVKARDYTPKILVDHGVKNKPMLMTRNHVRSTILTEDEAKVRGLKTGKGINYHGLGKKLLMKTIDNLDKPNEIYKKNDDTYLIVTRTKDQSGNEIIVPVRIDGTGVYNDVYIEENHILSAYGKKNLDAYLNRNGFELIYKKSDTTLNKGVQYSNVGDTADNSISQVGENVNREFSVSEEQQTDDNDIRYSISPSFETEIDAWDQKTEGFSFVVGNTSEALQKAGISKKQIRMDATKIKKLLDKHSGMSIEIIKQIPQLLEEPVIVIDSKQDDNSKIVMGELYDDNGKLVTAVLLLAPTSRGGNVLDMIKISSAEGRGHIGSLFRKEDGTPVEVRYVDEKRIRDWLNVNRLQLPLRNLGLDSDNSISQVDENVKREFSVSESDDPESKRVTVEADRIAEERAKNKENLKHQKYVDWWSKNLALQDARDKTDRQLKRERLKGEQKLFDEKQREEKRIADEQYKTWWQKALSDEDRKRELEARRDDIRESKEMHDRFDQERKERKKRNKKTEEEARPEEIESGDIRTVAQRLDANLENAQAELDDLWAMRENTAEDYRSDLALMQELYQSMENKNTEKANALERRIARIERRAKDEDAAYLKRIADVEGRIERINKKIATVNVLEDKETVDDRLLARQKKREERKTVAKAETAFKRLGFDIDGAIVDNYEDAAGIIEDNSLAAQVERDINKYVADNQIQTYVDNTAKLLARGEMKPENVALTGNDLKQAKTLADMYRQFLEISKNNIRAQGVKTTDAVNNRLDTIFSGYDWFSDKGKKAKRLGSQLQLNLSSPEQVIRDVFGEGAVSKELNEYLIRPTIENSARARRQTNQMIAGLRKFGLNESESAVTQIFSEYSNLEESGSKKVAMSQDDLRAVLMGQLDADEVASKIENEEYKERNAKDAKEFHDSIVEQFEKAIKVNRAKANQRALREFKEGGGTNAGWSALSKAERQKKVDAAFAAVTDESIGRITEATKELRHLLDDMYDAINAISVIHGAQPIKFRRGYMPHSHKQTEELQKWFNDHMGGLNVTPVQDLPTDIAGKTADRKPNKRWFSHAQERTGPRTTWDALGNVEDYLRVANDTIYHIDDIRKMRVLERYIRGIYSVARGATGEEQRSRVRNDVMQRLHGELDDDELVFLGLKKREQPKISDEDMDLSQMTPFVTWLTNYANDLAAKQIFNRDIEAIAGRKYNNLANTITSWSSRVMMQYNISSNLKQLSQIGAVSGDVGVRISKDAAEMTLKSMRNLGNGSNDLEQKYHISERSTFLAEKQAVEEATFASDKDLTEKQKTDRQHAKDIWDNAWSFTDMAMSRYAVYSYFMEGMARGMDDTAALRYADTKARNILASRMKGASPLIFQSKNPILRMFTLFQREPLAAWQDVLKTMPREYAEMKNIKGEQEAKTWMAKRVTGRVLGASMVNTFYAAVLGLGTPAMFDLLGDPLRRILEKVMRELTPDEEDDITWEETGKRFLAGIKDEVVDDVPFANLLGLIANTYTGSEFETRLALNVPDIGKIFGLLGLGKDAVDLAAKIAQEDDPEKIEALQEQLASVPGQIPIALLHTLTEIVGTAAPAGNQLRKSAEGLIAVLRAGEYTDDGRLKYEVGGLDIIPALLYGKSGTRAAQEWAKDDFDTLSKAESEAYRDLIEIGVSPAKAARYVQIVSAAEKIDTTETQAQAEGRIIDGMDELDAEQKAELYYDMVATDTQREAVDLAVEAGATMTDAVETARAIRDASKRLDKITALIASDMETDAREAMYLAMVATKTKDADGNVVGTEDDERLEAMYATGLDFDDFLDAKQMQSSLNADESLSGNGRATRFLAWVSKNGYTDAQADVIGEQFPFSSGFRVSPTTYQKMVDGGVEPDNAVAFSDALSGAERDIDKINAIWGTGIIGAQLDAAIKAVVSEKQYERYRIIIDANVPLEAYTWVLDNADIDGNGSISNEERELALSRLALDPSDLSALWLATGGSEKSNPYKGSAFGIKMPEINIPQIDMPELDFNIPHFDFEFNFGGNKT